MATADVQTPVDPAPAPGLPDYLTNSDAVLGDDSAKWRYGRAPDYTKTRKVFNETKSMNHEAGSLPDLVENLVKNWEIEASFKTDYADWRTVVPEKYTFAINGGPPQDASHMLKVGTYNAIIAPNDFYSPDTSDFASSHKTFKRMMPNFAWEVLEVYSGPPTVAFKWRHWGMMKNDYGGFNDKGEKITAKAHGGKIDIQGVTVAKVDEKVRVESLETWFDPLEMFRQISPEGIVTRVARVAIPGEDLAAALDSTPSTPTSNVPKAELNSTDEDVPTDRPVSLEPTKAAPTAESGILKQLAGITVPTDGNPDALNKLVLDLSTALEALKSALAADGKVKGRSTHSSQASHDSWVDVKENEQNQQSRTETSQPEIAVIDKVSQEKSSTMPVQQSREAVACGSVGQEASDNSGHEDTTLPSGAIQEVVSHESMSGGSSAAGGCPFFSGRASQNQ